MDELAVVKSTGGRTGRTDGSGGRTDGPGGRTGRKDRTDGRTAVPYTHLRAQETGRNLVCRLLLEKQNYYNSAKPSITDITHTRTHAHAQTHIDLLVYISV